MVGCDGSWRAFVAFPEGGEGLRGDLTDSAEAGKVTCQVCGVSCHLTCADHFMFLRSPLTIFSPIGTNAGVRAKTMVKVFVLAGSLFMAWKNGNVPRALSGTRQHGNAQLE